MARRLTKYVKPEWASWLVNAPSSYVQLAQRPTPIHPWRLPEVPNGFQVSIKRDDMTGSTLGGNKDPGKLGSDGNLLLERLCGTNIVAIPNVRYKNQGKKTEPDYVEGIEEKMFTLSAKLEKEGHKPFVIPVGGSNPMGTWGYIEGFREMMEQGVCEQFDDIVVAMGSGGTAEDLGIANYLTKSGLRIHAVLVIDDAAYFHEHISSNLKELNLVKEDGNLLRSDDIIDIIDGYKGVAYGVSTQQELDLLLRTSSHSGVMLDPVYTVKAVNGMLTEMANNPQRFKGKRVLFVHTGGLFDNFGKLNSLVKEVSATNQVKTLEEWLQ